jgi:hypothetical protein
MDAEGRRRRVNRSLDGVYFRIKRDGKYQNICFSDLTEVEQDDVMEERSEEWLKCMCKILAKVIKEIGDEFDIVCGGEEDD